MTVDISQDPSPGELAAQARAALAEALLRVAAGDRAAFDEVYRRTSAKLFGVCLRILPERHEAEEALQEAYLSVWKRAGTFDSTCGSPMTWLITLARNRAIDRVRRGRAIATAPIELADAVVDETQDVERQAGQIMEEARLARCMETLKAQDAGLIRTAFLEGSAYSELAARATMPLGTIKSRIRRALAKLRDCLA